MNEQLLSEQTEQTEQTEVLDFLKKFINEEDLNSFTGERPLLIEKIEETGESIEISMLPGCDAGRLLEVAYAITDKIDNSKIVKIIGRNKEIIVRSRQANEDEVE